MATTLGALTLPYQTEWADQYRWTSRRGQSRRTLGGTWHYTQQAISGGRPITLQCRDGIAWWTDADVAALQTMATSGGTYAFVWGSATHTVIFDHERADPIEFEPVWPASGYWTGTVYLREVIT